jgi:hypothetical protein
MNNNGKWNLSSTSVAFTQLPDPVLSICWTSSNAQVGTIICGCGDGSIRLWDAQKNQNSVIGKHEKGIAKVEMQNEQNLILAMSYNEMLAIWDIRKNTVAMKIPFMNFHPTYLAYFHPFIAFLAAEQKVAIAEFDLIFKTSKFENCTLIDNKLKKYYSSFEGFHGNPALGSLHGYALGNIEGRIEIRQFLSSFNDLKEETGEKAKFNYTFKAHYEQSNNFAANSIAYNKVYGTLATGVFN